MVAGGGGFGQRSKGGERQDLTPSSPLARFLCAQVKAALLHGCEHAMTELPLSGCSPGFAGFP